MENFKNRVGETNISNQGLKMIIVNYNRAKDIDVQFEDEFVFKNTTYQNFKKGEIRNPCYPEVYGIGFNGFGNYKTRENGKKTKLYDIWHSMLERCYDEKCQQKHPTYKGCKVCEEWLNFQNFAKWYEDNIWNEECVILDKDILIKGNKIYSPNACILVDRRLNLLFTKSDKARGKYPIGIHYHKNNKKFQVGCSVMINGKKQSKHLGYYNTTQKAFETYKTFKEQYVKQIADEYKEKYPNFPQQLYTAMYKYEVEIMD